MGKRDFTSATLGEMGENFGAGIVDENIGGWDWLQDFGASLEFWDTLKDDMSNVTNYLNNVCQINDITAEKLTEIIENVNAIENTYAAKFEGSAVAVQSYNSMIETFTDEMCGNFPENVDFTKLIENLQPHLLVIDDFKKAYMVEMQDEIQLELDKMVNEDGTYNWEYVKQLLQMPLEDLSLVQLMALSQFYLQIDDTPEVLDENGNVAVPARTAEENIKNFMNSGYVLDATYFAHDGNNAEVTYIYNLSDVFLAVALLTTLTAQVIGSATIWNPDYDPATSDITPEQAQRIIMLAAILKNVCDYSSTVSYNPKNLPQTFPPITNIDLKGDGMYTVDFASGLNVDGYALSNPEELDINFSTDSAAEFYQRLAPDGSGLFGDIFGPVGEWLMGFGIEQLLTLTLASILGIPFSAISIPLAAAISATVSITTGIAGNINDYYADELLRALVEGRISADQYILGIKMLGFSLQYHMLNDSVLVPEYIHKEAKAWAIMYNGFKYYYPAHKNVGETDLQLIILNGNPDREGWKPIEGLDEEKQRQIYKDYVGYYTGDRDTEYKESIKSKCDVKYPDKEYEELTVEEVMKAIHERNQEKV